MEIRTDFPRWHGLVASVLSGKNRPDKERKGMKPQKGKLRENFLDAKKDMK